MTSTTPNEPQALFQNAVAAYNAGDFERAYGLCGQLIGSRPGHADAHYLAGLAANASNRSRAALPHLRKAASLDERSANYAVQLSRALCMDQQLGEAIDTANHALSLQPEDAIMLDNLGWIYQQANAHERALNLFRQAVARAPDHPLCRFNLAMALTFTNRLADAERELETCIELHPGYWRAYTLRSKLSRRTPEDNHLRQLEGLLSRCGRDPEANYFLNMALGKECEDLGRYAEAFAHFTRGKQAIRRHLRHEPQQFAALVDALIEAFPAAEDSHGYMSDEPIFVVGMPRSGTTLVERILSSHPEVYAAGELENFPATLHRLTESAIDAPFGKTMIEAARNIDARVIGRQYISSTRPMTTMKPRFVDKRPHNFLYLGFIARALPKARIICLRRDPMDTCLSNFREAFQPNASTHHYSFDLLDTGRHYQQFERIMAHWNRVLPGRVLEIDYESIVSNPHTATRKLLRYCGLPWDDRCLHFERNPAASSTASSVQVRSPLYRTAVQRWLKYEEQTRPLQELLGIRDARCKTG